MDIFELLECFCRCCDTIILTIPMDSVGDIIAIRKFAMERGLKVEIKIISDKFQITLSKALKARQKGKC